MVINNYDKIFLKYQKTNIKPDKKYSMLPTILKLASPIKNKTVLDIGCGDGFFTFAFAEKAKMVYGIDNSTNQIKEAKKSSKSNTEFILEDMKVFKYPIVDIINAPFVIGYIKSRTELKQLFGKCYNSLNKSGKMIGIIDMPKSIFHNNKRFGSIKKVEGDFLKEGSDLIIELYNDDIKISKKGLDKFGKPYWDEYLNNLDITYFTAIKK